LSVDSDGELSVGDTTTAELERGRARGRCTNTSLNDDSNRRLNNRHSRLYDDTHTNIDREFVTSAKKVANFNELSEIKKIRTKIR